MDNFLLISNIILWVCVVGLSLLVLALVRQVGVLYERISPAGALMVEQSLKVGDEAPILTVKDANSRQDIAIGGDNVNGKSQLLFFVSPDCPVCKTLLPALKSAGKAEEKWLDVVLATDGDNVEIERFIDQQVLRSLPMANSELLGKSYGVAKLPYGVLIDSKGAVKSMGLINSREHLESLFVADETNTASLQEYLQRKQA